MVGNFESLAQERVADLLNSVADLGAILEDYHISSFFCESLLKVVIERKRISSCRSEEKTCHAVLFVALDRTSDNFYAHSDLDHLIVLSCIIVSMDEIFYVLINGNAY